MVIRVNGTSKSEVNRRLKNGEEIIVDNPKYVSSPLPRVYDYFKMENKELIRDMNYPGAYQKKASVLWNSLSEEEKNHYKQEVESLSPTESKTVKLKDIEEQQIIVVMYDDYDPWCGRSGTGYSWGIWNGKRVQ